MTDHILSSARLPQSVVVVVVSALPLNCLHVMERVYVTLLLPTIVWWETDFTLCDSAQTALLLAVLRAVLIRRLTLQTVEHVALL